MVGAPGGDYAEGARQAAMRRQDLAQAAGGMEPSSLDKIQRGISGFMGGLGNRELQPDAGFSRPWAPRAGGLGLGLGLNRWQRGGLLQAAQQGQGAEYLGTHPGIANRVENRIEAGSPQEERLQRFIGTGEAPSGATLRTGPPPGIARRMARQERMRGALEASKRPLQIGPGMIDRGIPQGPGVGGAPGGLQSAGEALAGEIQRPVLRGPNMHGPARGGALGALGGARMAARQQMRRMGR